MSRKNVAPELRKRPHEVDDQGRQVVESLLVVAERLDLLPSGMEYKRTIADIWPWMTPKQIRDARSWAKAVERKRKKWAGIVIAVTPPTPRTPELLITVQNTRAVLRIRPSEAVIWRRGEIVHSSGGIERRVGWFDIRQPGLWWAREVALIWAAKLASPPVELVPVTAAPMPTVSSVTEEHVQ